MAICSLLNRFWRIVGTALGFVFFGLGALFLGNIYMICVRILFKDRNKRRKLSQKGIQYCFHLFLRTLKFFGILDYQIDGVDILCGDKKCLIIANHPSLIDYVLIGSVLPEMDCIVKESLFYNPFCKMVVKNADYIPNSTDPQKLLLQCQQRLSNGGRLLIFPEGTRTPLNANKLTLQRGAANIAIRCSVPMRIIHIVCEPRILNKQMPWYKVPKSRPFFYVKVQQIQDVKPYLLSSEQPSKSVRRLTKDLTQLLQPTQEVINFIKEKQCKN